ncbi:hypothetical protein, partial [Pseudomonas poae]|uniref:hypothetical protein n=1 Tax=Pseudomonas poae TaxID=200451 RepID=UPI001F485AC7
MTKTVHDFLCDVSQPLPKNTKEAPINLPRGGGKSKFPRDAALFAKKRPMLRVLRAISSALP